MVVMSSQLHAQGTLSQGKRPWIGDWVDPTANLDVMKKRKIPAQN
jgi:hypothetical protein